MITVKLQKIDFGNGGLLASILKKEGYCLSSLDSDGIQTWERFDYF
jgi:hypothetical protein